MFKPNDVVVIDYPMSGNHNQEVTVIEMIEDPYHGLLAKCTWKDKDGIDKFHEYTVKILKLKT